jgi:N-acetylneuraminate lyase
MKQITGLVAAAFSPMNKDGSINPDIIAPITERLLKSGVAGLYVCGSTGEGPLLSTSERKQVAQHYIQASQKRIPVIVHVGHDSLPEAQSLARHAAETGADAIASVGPCYFKPLTLEILIEFLAQIALAAPKTDFYYYHVPQLSGNQFDMIELFEKAPQSIPTFKGVKYTALTVHEFQECKERFGERFALFFGCDEMLTSGLAGGAQAAIGSTYNLVPRLYRRIIEAFAAGDVETSRSLQSLSVRMVRVFYRYRGLPAIKAMMRLIGLDCGPVRLPLKALSADEFKRFEADIDALALRQWF